ncbi:A-kinase anchor protein 8-like isoform X2 [Protopterus annectens]|uniref:A-kinase anchor protein 8-like isoform X2 n=1 Tax=Protopterus annectens TaxID=7888 RepID=UPI001CFB6FBF|nr:A-kinase anchor protein 8-like isoform X2 [Protopterus annectens]
MAGYGGYGSGWNSGSRGYDGYDPYESYDSRASLNDRDLYRSGYGYGEAGPDYDAYGGRYDSSYGNRRDQTQNRMRGQSWAREGRFKPMVSTGSGRGGGRPQMGVRGLGASTPRLPSLFSQNIMPELSMFQGMRAFSGKRFGGALGFNNKQRQKRNRIRDKDKQQQKKKGKKEETGKKRKQSNSGDEPDSKVAKTDNSDSETEEKGEDQAKSDTEGKEEDGEDKKSEEIKQIKSKLQAGKKNQERQKKRQRDRMVERIQLVCSLCKFRTFYEDQMHSHLESKFHKEHFKFIGTKLPNKTSEFLQEYILNKCRKTEDRRKTVEDINAAIQQIQKDQDLTLDIGMEHFVKKVEAAHCAACDLFIPMQYAILQKHLKSADHNRNRKATMEQSKKTCLVVARSILNNKLISKKLERYLKGEDPFTEEAEKEDQEGEGAKEAKEGGEGEGEKTEENVEGGDETAEVKEEEEGGEETIQEPTEELDQTITEEDGKAEDAEGDEEEEETEAVE